MTVVERRIALDRARLQVRALEALEPLRPELVNRQLGIAQELGRHPVLSQFPRTLLVGFFFVRRRTVLPQSYFAMALPEGISVIERIDLLAARVRSFPDSHQDFLPFEGFRSVAAQRRTNSPVALGMGEVPRSHLDTVIGCTPSFFARFTWSRPSAFRARLSCSAVTQSTKHGA